MNNISRRKSIKMSATIAAGLVAASLPAQSVKKNDEKRIKLLVIGAHPDDPETGCGGLISKYVKNGHEVVAVYLTGGEAGIPGKTHSEAAAIRTREAKKACDILGIRPVFVGQIDGNTKLDAQRYDDMRRVIEKENPDVVITHWPIDTHRDHRICSLLVYDAWLNSGEAYALYYFEVMTGEQSQNFNPTDYVDITDVIDTKHKACYQHVSQHIEEDYFNDLLHGKMEVFRGMEGGFKYAEAYVKQVKSKKMVL
jgi:LmbE family N-acetylglucosaminyl deacetylase